MKRRIRIKRLRQWTRIVLLQRGNYAVIYTDEFGQVVAFDTHGPLIESRLSARRDLRLTDILHKKALVANER